MTIQDLLQIAIDRHASDIHLVSGYYPTYRIDGELYQFPTLEMLTPEIMQSLILSTLTPEQKENLLVNREIDYGYQYNGNRFRVNAYHSFNTMTASLRLIPSKINDINELHLPPAMGQLGAFTSGLVLVTGPTGEGKSTTLASIIQNINQTKSKHIITVEDPIEFVYPKGKSIISQRELHQDTHSWTIALRSVLREDPDVVLVGEMRDFESTQLVLTIAETGHLVFSTLHTSSTPEAINRIIDIFPSHQQNQIRSQLASVLRAVIAQRLVPAASGQGRIPAVELLYNSPAVASIIREGKSFMLENVLQTSDKDGFIFFEKNLAELCNNGQITKEAAFQFAIRPKELDKYLRKQI
jgi:twitching motility protein PilT